MATGLQLTDLATGRWDARWTLTDRLGNQRTRLTSFTVEPPQTGPTGNTGNTGKEGPAGSPGTPGAPGPTGSTGATGAGGAPGSPGANGAAGRNGRNATVTCKVGTPRKGKVRVTCLVSGSVKAANIRLLRGNKTLRTARTEAHQRRLIFTIQSPTAQLRPKRLLLKLMLRSGKQQQVLLPAVHRR